MRRFEGGSTVETADRKEDDRLRSASGHFFFSIAPSLSVVAPSPTARLSQHMTYVHKVSQEKVKSK